ncbi:MULTISPECIES: type IV pilus assembly protein FimV [Anoxybacillaceae]|uniref:type IV pilus assembly protein FimV n=1 Tax=Anoxybacillaceae TaxID=3120669 RepID=UPI0008251A37|nr:MULTISPECIES: LysM domain-containing protein [Anoxybacillus]MBB3906875.1 hypothetical protein [Anoxybacillus rupiensis]QHC04788.1 hypothetical protein GRQ40_13105 [Anoxybacillus sp. PDR2]
MRKLMKVCAVCLAIYIIYHDVTKGTLPVSEQKVAHAPSAKTETAASSSYRVIKVQAGDTLLSIMEREQGQSLPVSIEELIEDFEALNPGIKATSIQIGKAYKFPIYK